MEGTYRDRIPWRRISTMRSSGRNLHSVYQLHVDDPLVRKGGKERDTRRTYPRKATCCMIILSIPNFPDPLLGFMGSSSIIVQIRLIISYSSGEKD